MDLILYTDSLGDINYSFEKGFSEDIPIYLDGKDQEPFVYLFEQTITNDNIDTAERLLNCLDELFAKGKKELLAESADNETVKYFLEFHYDQLPEETAQACGKFSIDDVTYRDVVNSLTLGGISLNKNDYGFLVLTLDYVIDKNVSDELLVVAFDENYEIVTISHES